MAAAHLLAIANVYRLVGLKRVSAVRGTEWELFSDFVDDSEAGPVKQEALEI